MYVGLDVHAHTSTYCILDEHGKCVKTHTVKGPWAALMLELQKIPRPFKICYEACLGYGWLYDELAQIAESIQVAHPGQVRLIFRAKRKNDRVDAQKLAKLLYLESVPMVYVPGVKAREWRRLIEFRHGQVQARARTKNQIRSLLRRHAISAPRGLWTKKGLEWLQTLSMPTPEAALERTMHLQTLANQTSMLRTMEDELNRRARKHPGVKLLCTIPGVGLRTAEAMAAYIDSPQRFNRVKSFGSYLGLVPSQDSSAGKNRLGHITKQGPSTVRRLLGEAAWQAVRRSSHIRAYFNRIRQDNPDRTKIAIVATAHYLARIMLAMLRTGETFRFTAA